MGDTLTLCILYIFSLKSPDPPYKRTLPYARTRSHTRLHTLEITNLWGVRGVRGIFHVTY